ESIWSNAVQVQINQVNPASGCIDGVNGTGTAYMLWSDDSWYVYVQVHDDDILEPAEEMQAEQPWYTDSVEVFLDLHRNDGNIHQLRVDCSEWPSYYMNTNGEITAYGPEAAAPYFDAYAVQLTDDGYCVEMSINLSSLDDYHPMVGDDIGLQLQINNVTTEVPDGFYTCYNMESSLGAGSWEPENYDYVILGDEETPEATPIERYEVNVYKNTPTVDGFINQDEWDFENAIEMNAENCVAWVGEFTCPVLFVYSWDDIGLYCAAQVIDPDVCTTPSDRCVYEFDAFQIALDPGGLIGESQGGGGMFYSIGLMEDGTLRAVYHPYGGEPEDMEYTGAGRITDNGWEFEILIPWTSIEILADDGFEWHHGDGTFSNAKICYLDRSNGGADSNLYTVALEGTGTGFDTTEYAYRLNFMNNASEDIPDTTPIERYEVNVYKNTPTVDGVINQDEWDFENVIEMNADNCFAWDGEFTCPVYVYYSWDDIGLYCAAQAIDPDVCLAPADGNPYQMDTFQFALDPGGLIGEGQGDGGMWFSIGLMEDGSLGAVYHPYGYGSGEPFEYTGAGRTTDNGWEFEILIPWSSIEILADDGFEWHHGDGTFSNAKICYLDRNDRGAETNAYTVSLEGTDVGMDPTEYAYRLNFMNNASEDIP
ncbi:MAG: sugar-binding protein, partial [Eubacteriales bacterium]